MQIVNEKTVADQLNISVAKLRMDRVKKRGLPFYKIGNLVRYNMDQVLKHLEAKGFQKIKKASLVEALRKILYG